MARKKIWENADAIFNRLNLFKFIEITVLFYWVYIDRCIKFIKFIICHQCLRWWLDVDSVSSDHIKQ